MVELIERKEQADGIEIIQLVQLIEHRTDKCNKRDTQIECIEDTKRIAFIELL